VLIIEIDDAARDALREQMEMWGNEVRLAASPEEGLAAMQAFRPHIVLCDLGLPGIDRFDRLRVPRSDPDGRRVLFAAVTSAGGVDDEARALAAGYDSVLVRPLEADSLAKLLRSYANLPSAVQ
jgi:CheY-like chemotaxis protein